jgi:hypothetical protein
VGIVITRFLQGRFRQAQSFPGIHRAGVILSKRCFFLKHCFFKRRFFLYRKSGTGHQVLIISDENPYPQVRNFRIFRPDFLTDLEKLYRLKRDGYEAMIGEEWIRGYYILKELSRRNPEDPDARNFLARCEEELGRIVFFTDELELRIGEILMGPVFSFPGRYEGRAAVRCSSLSAFPGFTYVLGLELMTFNPQGELTGRVEAPYAKFLPVRVSGRERTVVLMRALDRLDKNTHWGPHWTGSQHSEIGDDQIILDVPYEDFLLITRISRGVDSLFMGELSIAADRMGNYGFIPQVFQAEILRRLSNSALHLSLTIFALLLGWRFRAKKHLRFVWLPMLGVLPLIANGAVYGYRHIFDDLDIGMILSLGFPLAVFISMAGSLILFVLALVLLAAQHG